MNESELTEIEQKLQQIHELANQALGFVQGRNPEEIKNLQDELAILKVLIKNFMTYAKNPNYPDKSGEEETQYKRIMDAIEIAPLLGEERNIHNTTVEQLTQKLKEIIFNCDVIHGTIQKFFYRKIGPKTAATAVHLKIQEAREFFRKNDIPIGEDGLISTNLTPQQIAFLYNWREKTSAKEIEMPTEDIFYYKVYVAVSLWRQKTGQTINYLLGKGTGIEVALRGHVLGRARRNFDISYRSHSDFELYGVEATYSPQFRAVFGAQEYYPPTMTKGLKEIHQHLLHDTAETVDFGGIPVLIPQLELLFLDKMIKKEGTPRREGYDAMLLSLEYPLNKELILKYLDLFVIQPNVNKVTTDVDYVVKYHVIGIRKYYNDVKNALLYRLEHNPTQEEIVNEINMEAEKTPFPLSGKGIKKELWIPLSPYQIDEQGNVTTDFISGIKQLAPAYIQWQIENAKIHSASGEIQNLFLEIDAYLKKLNIA